MSPDLLAVIARGVGFVGLFQAAGALLFVRLFGEPPGAAQDRIRHLMLVCAAVAFVSLAFQQALEAARLAGELSGIFDANLQRLTWHSSSGLAQMLRLLGLLAIVIGVARRDRPMRWVALSGAAVAVLSFVVTGHTSTDSSRALLAPLLGMHLLLVAFWAGALVPLYLISDEPARAYAIPVLRKFSAIAGALVPFIAIAGILMAFLLAPDLAMLRQPYGELLLLKLALFTALMGFAGYNKWRLVPAMERGEASAPAALRRSIATEAVLIVAVLCVTAVLTEFFSPAS
jgi:copper resistance protein D